MASDSSGSSGRLARGSHRRRRTICGHRISLSNQPDRFGPMRGAMVWKSCVRGCRARGGPCCVPHCDWVRVGCARLQASGGDRDVLSRYNCRDSDGG
jgi:hypothetical protein